MMRRLIIIKEPCKHSEVTRKANQLVKTDKKQLNAIKSEHHKKTCVQRHAAQMSRLHGDLIICTSVKDEWRCSSEEEAWIWLPSTSARDETQRERASDLSSFV